MGVVGVGANRGGGGGGGGGDSHLVGSRDPPPWLEPSSTTLPNFYYPLLTCPFPRLAGRHECLRCWCFSTIRFRLTMFRYDFCWMQFQQS